MQIPIISQRSQNKPWPSRPRINKDHSLARGLSFYVYCDGGASQFDLVGNRWSSNVSGSFAGANTALGNGLEDTQAVASGSKVAVIWAGGPATVTSDGAGGGDYTLAIRHLIKTAPGAGTGPDVFGQTSTGLVKVAGIYYRMTSGPIATPHAWTDLTDIAGTTNCFGLNHTVAARRSSGTLSCWVNGANQGSGPDSTSVLASSSNVYLGVESDGTTQTSSTLDNVYLYAAAWNRALTDAEMLQLHLDPYCFLIFPEDEIFATLIGVGGVVDILAAQIWL